GPVHKRGELVVEQKTHDAADRAERGLDLLVVAAALQRVLHLQLQMGGKPTQVDVLIGGDPGGVVVRLVEATHVVADVRATVVDPASAVGTTKWPARLPPQTAAWDRASRWWIFDIFHG